MPTSTDTIITTREQLFALPSGSFFIIDGVESGRIATSLKHGPMFYSYNRFGNYAYSIRKEDFPENLTVEFKLLWSPPQS